MTPEQIKTDENFLCGLELPDIKLNVYLTYAGGERVTYHAFWQERLLFSGNDFKPSPMHGQDSIDAVISLLGFLTLKVGDTDREYFKDYTPAQIKWSESSECEILSGQCSDYEDKDSEYFDEANKYLTQYFIQ